MNNASRNSGAQLPVLLKWNEYRRALVWDSSAWGFHRGWYQEIDADQLTGQVILLPAAQGIRPEAKPGASVFVGVKGDVAITVQEMTYVVGAYDVLSIPANMPFSYVNIDLESALLFMMVAKAGKAAEGTPASLGDWHESPKSPVYMPWQEVRRQFTWQLPRAEGWGSHRGTGPHVFSGTLSGHLVREPSAQSSPWHAPSRDIIFIQLAGEVEFTAAGRRWHLEPLDLFMMPANVPYVYTNIGLVESLFCDTGGRVRAGSTTVYWESDPGWPIGTQAEVLETEAAPDGGRRAVKR